MKRTCVTSMYNGVAANRWVHTTRVRPDSQLWQQCVWQWKKSTATRAATVCQRLALTAPLFPCVRQFEPRRR
jgi:hypothetical protein